MFLTPCVNSQTVSQAYDSCRTAGAVRSNWIQASSMKLAPLPPSALRSRTALVIFRPDALIRAGFGTQWPSTTYRSPDGLPKSSISCKSEPTKPMKTGNIKMCWEAARSLEIAEVYENKTGYKK
jgi:hypothetical protein